ncbi:MBL fold metallo-hydrolase [Chloroflexota bacterium]
MIRLKRRGLLFLMLVVILLSACSGLGETPTSTPLSTATPTAAVPTPTSTVIPTPTMTSAPTNGEFKVHFIDVGQGDSILVDLGETEILIDGGGRSPGVVQYLRNYVDGSLDLMVATHPHADHIGGLIGVLDAFEVDEIWHNGDFSTSQTYADFMGAIQVEGAQVHIARRGDKVINGKLTFTVVHPFDLQGTTNNNSIVLRFSYGEIDFLFTGDAEVEAEGDMLVQSVIQMPDVEVLKVGHHGSRTASSPAFLAAIQPEVPIIAIYMAGTGNQYGHPHEETITALNEVGAEIYGTDTHGTIIVSSDGFYLRVS